MTGSRRPVLSPSAAGHRAGAPLLAANCWVARLARAGGVAVWGRTTSETAPGERCRRASVPAFLAPLPEPLSERVRGLLRFLEAGDDLLVPRCRPRQARSSVHEGVGKQPSSGTLDAGHLARRLIAVTIACGVPDEA
jgi:hypothetical protein